MLLYSAPYNGESNGNKMEHEIETGRNTGI